MSNDNQRKLKVILREVERLGCTVKPTNSGYMIRAQDGGQVAVHRSSSANGATDRILRDLRKIGINLHTKG